MHVAKHDTSCRNEFNVILSKFQEIDKISGFSLTFYDYS